MTLIIKLLVIGILIFVVAFLGFVFSRFQWKTKLFTIGLVVVTAVICSISVIHWHFPRSFSSEEWKEAGERYRKEGIQRYDIRRLMVDDLLHKYSFTDMAQEEVVQILGQPDYQDKNNKDKLSYSIAGYTKLWPFPSDDVLVIHLDKDGKTKRLLVTGSERGHIVDRVLRRQSMGTGVPHE